MAGPLETAFVEIVAQLEVGDLEDELSGAIGRAVSRAETHLKRLERAGIDAADSIGVALSDIGDKVDVRRALISLGEVEQAAESVNRTVSSLGGLALDVNTTPAGEALDKLVAEMDLLGLRVRELDTTGVNPHFDEFQSDLRQVLLRVDELQKAIRDVGSFAPNVNTKPALEKLDALARAADGALRNVEQLDGRRLDIKVEDVQVEKLIDDVERAERQLRVLDDQHPHITATFDDRELISSVRRSSEKAATEANSTLERAFKRVIAFGIAGLVTRGAIQATQQLVSAGIAAAGAIENTQIALNRFFAQSKDLGETSAAFFKDLQQLALNTPFQFQGLADTSRRILAMGTTAKEAATDLGIMADAVASVGGT